jgi:hypothetical protein
MAVTEMVRKDPYFGYLVVNVAASDGSLTLVSTEIHTSQAAALTAANAHAAGGSKIEGDYLVMKVDIIGGRTYTA